MIASLLSPKFFDERHRRAGWGRSRRNRGFCGLPEQKSLISWPVMVGGIA
jgi:hypothetical protein